MELACQAGGTAEAKNRDEAARRKVGREEGAAQESCQAGQKSEKAGEKITRRAQALIRRRFLQSITCGLSERPGEYRRAVTIRKADYLNVYQPQDIIN